MSAHTSKRVGDLARREHPLVSEPLLPRAEAVTAPDLFSTMRRVNRLSVPDVATGVQQRGDLLVGVRLEQLVDQRDDLGAGLAQLPGIQRGRRV